MFSKDKYNALKLLLDFNYKYIYKNPVKMTENEKIKRMFRELFELYLKDLETENKESSIYEWFLDNMSEEYLRSNSKPRIVLDYIAGMTDDFFNMSLRDMCFRKLWVLHGTVTISAKCNKRQIIERNEFRCRMAN